MITMLDDNYGRWMQTLLTFLLLAFIVVDDLGIAGCRLKQRADFRICR